MCVSIQEICLRVGRIKNFNVLYVFYYGTLIVRLIFITHFQYYSSIWTA